MFSKDSADLDWSHVPPKPGGRCRTAKVAFGKAFSHGGTARERKRCMTNPARRDSRKEALVWNEKGLGEIGSANPRRKARRRGGPIRVFPLQAY